VPRNNRTARGGRKVKPAEVEEDLKLDQVRSSLRRTVTRRGVDYVVQNVSGSSDVVKTWICPHCNVDIKTGTAHVVAWDAIRGVDTRRHFHTQCFNSFQGPLL
jgi:Ribonuclease G/E